MNAPFLSKELLEQLLPLGEAAPPIHAILRLIETYGQNFSPDAGEAIANHLMSHDANAAAIEEALRALGQESAPLARFIRARMLAYRGENAAALEELDRVLRASASPHLQILLHRVRALVRERRFGEAIADFQSALALSPPYSFFVRSEKILNQLMGCQDWKPRRRVKAAILSSSTTAMLAPVLRASAFKRGLHLDFYEGAFGNFQQEILDPQSNLYRFQPDLVLLIPNHRDLGLPPTGARPQADEFGRRLRSLWQILRERISCHVIQVGFDLPPGRAWGSLEDSLPEGRGRVIRGLNLALTEEMPTGVSFVDPSEVSAQIGRAFWSDSEWHGFKQYPATTALPLFADLLCSHGAAAMGLSAKVLALDLDNTLWGGVIGEDLLGGIRIGPPSPEGEGYLELQKYAKELQQRGVLLVVCSKNNPNDAELPFQKHDAMWLKLDDFAAFVANWNDKAANLRTIAADLSLGLDSFVFLDDNPVERALIRAKLPQVIVPECGTAPWEMLASLQRGLYFQSVTITKEDLDRHSTYRGNVARKALERSTASLDDFLASLEMAAEHGPVDAQTLPRVTQLINKTNQFNLTTRRYTEEQVRAMAASRDWWCHWFKLADRFSEYGLIGVMLVKKGGAQWLVDTWLMSCRVLGRNMEEFMLACLVRAARDGGAREIVGQFIPTEKNVLVQDLYSRLGFAPRPESPGSFVLDVFQPYTSKTNFIRGL